MCYILWSLSLCIVDINSPFFSVEQVVVPPKFCYGDCGFLAPGYNKIVNLTSENPPYGRSEVVITLPRSGSGHEFTQTFISSGIDGAL